MNKEHRNEIDKIMLAASENTLVKNKLISLGEIDPNTDCWNGKFDREIVFKKLGGAK